MDDSAPLRPARPEDLPHLQDLAHRTIDASYRPFLGDEAVEGFLGSGASDAHIAGHLDRGGVHVLERGGRILGLVILEGETLDLIMVDVDRHREGLGSILLRGAEELLLAEHEQIRLETFVGNESALAFYLACGWEIAERHAAGGGMPERLVLHRGRAGRSTEGPR